MHMGRPPIIWALLGSRAGDNAQVLELARLLGWPVVEKRLRYGLLRAVPNLLLGASLASLDREASDRLDPPWPDLVIAVGRRSVPVARWIRAQAAGRTKLVHLGRPRAPLAWFDLVVTTPQYALPDGENTVEIPLPIVKIPAATTPDAAMWRTRFDALPRPWIGVLVGGTRFPFVFGSSEAARLASDIENDIGSVLVSTSPRTGPAATAVLKERLAGRGHVHDWQADGPNPHQAILALADRFLVTGDSASMIAEAAATRKPVRILPLRRQPLAWHWQAKHGLAASLARAGLLSPPRDPGLIRVPEKPYDLEPLLERIRAMVPDGN